MALGRNGSPSLPIPRARPRRTAPKTRLVVLREETSQLPVHAAASIRTSPLAVWQTISRAASSGEVSSKRQGARHRTREGRDVQIGTDAGGDTDDNVARSAVGAQTAGMRPANPNVARGRPCLHRRRRVGNVDVAACEADVDVAAGPLDRDVAACSLDAEGATDRETAEVTARRGDRDIRVDVGEAHVAARGRRANRPQPPRRVEIGRRGLRGDA